MEMKGKRAYDSNKNIKGRKRHIMVDVMGSPLAVVVHKASTQERAGAKLLLQRAVLKGFHCLQLIWADGGCSGQPMVDWVWQLAGWVFEVIKRTEETVGFVVLPRRWVVEQTSAWLRRYRRLSKDHEQLPETSEAMTYAAMVRTMLHRLARNPALAF
jgi:putative transposase